MLNPIIGESRTLDVVFSFPMMYDGEHWDFLFKVEIRRISRSIYTYFWKEGTLGRGQGQCKITRRWDIAKMVIWNKLYQYARLHAVDWNDMDFERSGTTVIPDTKLSTGQ